MMIMTVCLLCRHLNEFVAVEFPWTELANFQASFSDAYSRPKCIQQSSSSEADSHSASEEITRLLRNPKVYYSVHKSPQLVAILSQFHPVRILISNLFKIHFNIIFPCTCMSPKRSHPLTLLSKISYSFVIQACALPQAQCHTRCKAAHVLPEQTAATQLTYIVTSLHLLCQRKKSPVLFVTLVAAMRLSCGYSDVPWSNRGRGTCCPHTHLIHTFQTNTGIVPWNRPLPHTIASHSIFHILAVK
jgi:hypothetical protein